MDNQYGLLLNRNDIILQRKYFSECVTLLGVNVIHRAPRADKHYTTYAEIDANYYEPELVGVIFDEHPDQRTLRKLGWASELMENAAIISVPYDTKLLQKGSLFIIPSAYNQAEGRLFRVVEISGIMIYPASLTCKLVPEYANTFSNDSIDYKRSSFNLLNGEEN